MAVDVTPCERKYSKKLEDKTFIHKPNTIKGKPITIGHDYSQVVCIPEFSAEDAPWIIPLDMQRVKSSEIGYLKGMKQVKDLVKDECLPFHKYPTVCLGDCAYSAKDGLLAIKEELDRNLVFGARVKGDRKAYRAFAGKSGNNHPKWYGTELILNQPDKHFPADFKIQYHEKNVGHQGIKTEVSLWKNMLFKGSRDFNSIDFPCTLLRIESFRKNGKSAYEKPLWVAFYGKLRDEIFPFELVKLYSNRFKIEHFFKFIKQNMLMNDFQTPEVKHEESWCSLQQLAYLQLYRAKDLAQEYLHPWEKYLPKKSQHANLPPKKVQQYFLNIYKSLPGHHAKLVTRGRNSGRRKGELVEKRKNHDVIVKSKLEKKPKTANEPPLEKQFDSKVNSEDNLKTPKIPAKKVKPTVRKRASNPKTQSYYQSPLFPKQILSSLAMPQGQSP